jgi:hypothetical protein
MEEQVNIQETAEVAASEEQGAEICISDGSKLELLPGATVRLEELHPLPRLQMTVQQGEVRFETEQRSYEFVLPGCVLGLVRVPTSIIVELEGAGAQLRVEEGTVKCNLETGVLRLFSECEEVYLASGEEPEVSEYCEVAATGLVTDTTTTLPAVEAATATATPTSVVTATSTPTPTPTSTPTAPPSPTPTATRQFIPPTATPTLVPTLAPTPVPPTATSLPPPPPPSDDGDDDDHKEPTKPPPTKEPPPPPPPTKAPPTQPPPTKPRPTPEG